MPIAHTLEELDLEVNGCHSEGQVDPNPTQLLTNMNINTNFMIMSS